MAGKISCFGEDCRWDYGHAVFRLCAVWAELQLKPPLVKRYKGDWALITGGQE